MATVIVPTYLSEIAPAEHKGRIGIFVCLTDMLLVLTVHSRRPEPSRNRQRYLHRTVQLHRIQYRAHMAVRASRHSWHSSCTGAIEPENERKPCMAVTQERFNRRRSQ